MTKFFNWRAPVRSWLVLGMLMLLCACSRAEVTASDAQVSSPPEGRVSLTLVGYNYTNRYIDTFSVDGQGGGNLSVSSPTSGGGGSVCCVTYWRGLKAYTVKVRWQHGACRYQVRSDIADEVFDEIHSFYKEAEVIVDDRSVNDPSNFEVHFYPDGTVQAAVTDTMSAPRLLLSDERADRSSYPRCPNEQKPSK